MNSKKEELQGDFGVWLVIYVELITFGALFMGYALARYLNVEMFNESQLLLDKEAGFFNTLILITSSWFVIKSIESIKLSNKELAIKTAKKWLLFAMIFGIIFIISKVNELIHIFSQGIHLSTNTFFTFYILLAVFHLMHVLLCMVVLGILYTNTHEGNYTKENHIGLTSGGLYWHLVDLLWIVLFPLVYIIR